MESITMSRSRLTVVLSQAQGKHPARRALEESVVAALLMEPGLDVSVVPYLYDLGPDHTGRLFLESIPGDMVVLAWMYPRATFGVPDRWIYCLDLRDFNNHDPYVQEVRRIAEECRQRREAKAPPTLVQLGVSLAAEKPAAAPTFTPEQLLQQPGRRWYPVIDYSRCTNCMECIDFCLFGVYGVDGQDRIFVENQDSCKKGCPACSRVCPEHAIIFPDYKTPAIAGAPVGSVSGLKIDLTKLFGGADAIQIAAQERDRELVADGRQAVGLTVGIPKRQADRVQGPKDDLDKLTDALDALDI